jgi:hypothetical protein
MQNYWGAQAAGLLATAASRREVFCVLATDYTDGHRLVEMIRTSNRRAVIFEACERFV